MDEYEEIINKLLNMGVRGCIDNGEIIMFEDIPICEQNEKLNLADIN